MASSDALPALFGAAVGGLACMGGVIVTGIVNARSERRRHSRAGEEELVQILRIRTAEVFRLVFAVEHELNTICWFALHAPSKINDSRVDRYEHNVQALLPKINGVLAEIAG